MDGCLIFSGVLSGSLCNGMITRPEANYRVWYDYIYIYINYELDALIIIYS